MRCERAARDCWGSIQHRSMTIPFREAVVKYFQRKSALLREAHAGKKHSGARVRHRRVFKEEVSAMVVTPGDGDRATDDPYQTNQPCLQ